MQALAQGADIYGKASRLRSYGQGSGPLSAADALPAKLAAQQLSSLAGMSAKVQAAIMHSQRVFERQAKAVEQAVLQRAFYVSGSWSASSRLDEQGSPFITALPTICIGLAML